MSYDGLLAGAVADELKSRLIGSKIEKVQQPESDMVLLQIRTAEGRVRLLIDVSSLGSRVHLTELDYENPKDAPAFCMLLRKHIQGGRITDVRRNGNERMIDFHIETISEMGYSVNKLLIAETMGKYSNIILCDADSMKVIDSIKRVSIDINRVRQILPGIKYSRPPVSNLDNSLGLGPSAKIAAEMGSDLNERHPSVYLDENGLPKDVHIIKLLQYEGVLKRLDFDSTGAALDYYYSRKLGTNRVMQSAGNLKRQVDSLASKARIKKQKLLDEIKKADDSDIYRLKGELLTANIGKVLPGAKSVTVISYYDGSEVKIDLDERLSAAKNAQQYYRRYAKLKSSKKEKIAQLEECEKDIEYLESVSAIAENASSYDEIEEIKRELAEQGYTRQRKLKEKGGRSRPKPRRYRLESGLEVLVGRNNTENDYITFRMAAKGDWWFHAKDIHGSHAVLVCGGTDPSAEDMYGAAAIAAWFSKARNSENVPVDYAPVKHVKKPAGAKPGMVIFTNNGTVYIDPKDPGQKQL